ncbi:hypothetical protein BJ508DRAFT_410758 [Ascobolus immersus RN42]|uniref:U1-type domain-containing protein n=1 Tax=Ascobolus immersus RN42 TaxID=1160509 RepID=A0A3N4INE2_ASCIM|nr:hypothetical protein BJ508DRAFT_410758 [Ascobolus immersus RN42]
MSEYWKSTPKYYCKHCTTFVVDTKIGRTNHEATAKHQVALKRFLRELHRTSERNERDSERAKREVARLNALTGSGTVDTKETKEDGTDKPKPRPIAVPKPVAGLARKEQPRKQMTEAEKKAHMKQLEDLGVALPTEVRGEMAMAGEWQVVEEPVQPKANAFGIGPKLIMTEDEEADLERNLKRKYNGQMQELDAEMKAIKKWKPVEKIYTGDDEEDDLADLGPIKLKPKEVKVEPPPTGFVPIKLENEPTVRMMPVKTEPVEETIDTVAPKVEEPQVVFKARKARSVRKRE